MHLQLALHLPRDASSVPMVRRICTLMLESLQVSAEDVGDLALALTEACANVIDHAAHEHDYDVDLEIDGSTCLIRVTDRGGDSRPSERTEPSATAQVAGTHDDPGTAGTAQWSGTPDLAAIEALSSSGRGIALMESLMDVLRFRPTDGGTSVELVKNLAVSADSPLMVPTGP